MYATLSLTMRISLMELMSLMFMLMYTSSGLPAAATTINQSTNQLECGPMPNVMAAQPNIGGAFCESSVIPFLVPRRKVWLTPTAGVLCSNVVNIGERKTWDVKRILHQAKR